MPRRPDARSPGPSGPDEFSPTGGSCRRATLVAADIRPSCQQISPLTASGRSGAASPAALAAYAAAPRACAPICGMLAAWPAARAAATAAGALTSRAAAWATQLRRASPTPSSPRAKALSRAIASRGRRSPELPPRIIPAPAPRSPPPDPATIRRSASLSVCGEPTPTEGSVEVRTVGRINGSYEPRSHRTVVRDSAGV